MPELEQPNFPTGVKPHLSPNPKLTHELVDGGRETPVIVVTEPKQQVDLTEESAEIEALRGYVDTELPKKENVANKDTSIGSSANNTKYPTTKAVKDYVDANVGANVTALLAIFAPAYSATSTYAEGALVTHGNKLYACSTAIETAEEWTAAHWTETTISAQLAA